MSGDSVLLKTAEDIERMRRAGAIVAAILDELCRLVEPGLTTGALNAVAEQRMAEAGAEPLFKGVVNPAAHGPFPAVLCTSVNDEVVHGIPGHRQLADGDVISIDCGVRLDGFCGDSARTVGVGTIGEQAQRLLAVGEGALELAICEIRPDRLWSEVAEQIQGFIESAGMSVVRDYVGHGIGREMHEGGLKVPNYHDRSLPTRDFRLEPGLTLAVEPMVTLGSAGVRPAGPEAWVIVTRDGSYAAHFEHTLAVTETGAEVLTRRRS